MAEISAKYVIIGGGLAAASAVEGIRELDKEGPIIMVAREPELPYHRPPLSKDFLRRETAQPDIYVHDADFYKENKVEVLTGREAVSLDAGAKRVTLDDGRSLSYDKLLLATGSGSRTLDIPGANLDGVQYLRTVADSQRLQDAIGEGQRLVVVGGGFIGVEVAASAAQKGANVTLLNNNKVLWSHLFGPEVGSFFADLMQQHGITIINEDSATAIEGEGKAARVISKGGHRLEADLVVIGVGAAPFTHLAEQAGLRMAERGVDVNQNLQSSDPHIYVAGDIAAFDNDLYGRKLRVEHWDVAQNTGKAAGRNMAAAGEPYTTLPYFFSDEFDVAMEYLGNTKEWDEIIVRGDLKQKPFTVLYVKDDHVVAAIFINRNEEVEPVRKLIEGRTSVSANRARLADNAASLEGVA